MKMRLFIFLHCILGAFVFWRFIITADPITRRVAAYENAEGAPPSKGAREEMPALGGKRLPQK